MRWYDGIFIRSLIISFSPDCHVHFIVIFLRLYISALFLRRLFCVFILNGELNQNPKLEV